MSVLRGEQDHVVLPRLKQLAVRVGNAPWRMRSLEYPRVHRLRGVRTRCTVGHCVGFVSNDRLLYGVGMRVIKFTGTPVCSRARMRSPG